MIVVMASDHLDDPERPKGPPPARGWFVTCATCNRTRLVTRDDLWPSDAWLRCPHCAEAVGEGSDAA